MSNKSKSEPLSFHDVLTNVVFPFLIPVCIVAYALCRMKIYPDLAGLMDHLAFVVLCYLFLTLLLQIEWASLRVFVTFLFIFVLAIFYFTNSLYYEFFNSWGQIDTFKQWNDVPALWQGILTLSNFKDFIFYFVFPLLLWQLSMRDSTVSFIKFKAGLAILAVLLIVAHQTLAFNTMSYVQSNPFFFMVRQKRFSTSMAKVGTHHLPVTRALSQYQSINHSLYTYSDNDSYPFLKKLKSNIEPLPYAIKSKPNVILILMESMRAFEMGAYGAQTTFTPHLDKMAKEGIYFKNYYSPANQTIRAEFSILASYHPDVLGGPVYVNNPDLSVLTLPGLLKKNGYETHWIEANCSSYAQRKVNFLKSRGIDNFHTDVPLNHPPLGLGAADEDTFDYAFDIFSKAQKPFFAEIMTLSNHWQWNFDYPTAASTPGVEGDPTYKNYTKGIYYTDDAVYKFIQKIRQSPLFNNTIIILTGDHGVGYFPSSIPRNDVIWKNEITNRVPFIIWSPKLIKPRVVDSLGSHLDLAPTVLDLINLHSANSFMGTSLLRDDTGPRSVFMVRDGLWSLRIGNDFALVKNPGINLNTPPFNLKAYMGQVYGKEFGHLYFHSNRDLLENWSPEAVQPISDDAARHLERWGTSAIEAYHSVIYHNQIYPH